MLRATQFFLILPQVFSVQFLRSEQWTPSTDGFIPPNMKSHMRLMDIRAVPKECLKLYRVARPQVRWTWLSQTNCYHQTKWMCSFTTSMAQEMQRTGRTLRVRERIVPPSATGQLHFKILRTKTVLRGAAAEYFSQLLGFLLARFVARISTLPSSGSRASRTAVQRLTRRLCGVPPISQRIAQTQCLCLGRYRRLLALAPTAPSISSRSPQLRQRKALQRWAQTTVTFLATVMTRHGWGPECRLALHDLMSQHLQVIHLKSFLITLAQS